MAFVPELSNHPAQLVLDKGDGGLQRQRAECPGYFRRGSEPVCEKNELSKYKFDPQATHVRSELLLVHNGQPVSQSSQSINQSGGLF